MAIAAQTKVTADAFQALPEAMTLELLNGEVIEMGVPSLEHQRIVGRLFLALQSRVPDGEVFFAPIEVMLDEFNVPQPDLIWVAERSRNIISPARIEGPPELVVEVLSPTSYKRDRDVKFKLYERSGVQEYWLVSPPERSIMVWSLNDGRYQLIAVFDADEMLVSPLLGELPLGDLFSAQP